jgi:GH24 family phage-related lysozyme (muramidase)
MQQQSKQRFNPRVKIAALSLSAVAFVATAVHEGYTDEAVIPVKGDVPTFGFGMTTHSDGTRVQMGDRTDPVSALKRKLEYVQQAEGRIKQCVTAPVSQTEFDLLMDFSYQYGTGALCRSSIVRHTNAERYADACKAYLEYRFVAGYDCSTLVGGKPNKRCWGVWTRQQERHQKCMGQL